MAAHARDASPSECCGVLIGRAGEIVTSIRSANLAGDPRRRFLLDPAVHIRAMREARSNGLAVVGFYHSHPDSQPRPSALDGEGATYEQDRYAIVRPLTSGCEARLFRLTKKGFVEESMTTIAGGQPQGRPGPP